MAHIYSQRQNYYVTVSHTIFNNFMKNMKFVDITPVIVKKISLSIFLKIPESQLIHGTKTYLMRLMRFPRNYETRHDFLRIAET